MIDARSTFDVTLDEWLEISLCGIFRPRQIQTSQLEADVKVPSRAPKAWHFRLCVLPF
jgi:hypothetical protein